MIKDPEVDRLAVVRQLAEAEQQEFLAFAKGLTPQQWQAPTLCLGLSTRDIVVHVAWHFKNDDGAALVPLAVRSRFQLLRSGLRGGGKSSTTISGRDTDRYRPRASSLGCRHRSWWAADSLDRSVGPCSCSASSRPTS
jgi:hypothetical protein